MHLKNKNDLSDQILESQKNLQELRKRNQLTTFNQSSNNDKDKDKTDQEINIEEILNDLRRDIIRVFKNTIDHNADLHAKQTMDILTVFLAV